MSQSTQDSAPQHGRDMTRGSIPRHMIIFSMPMLAGNLIQSAYSIVNAIWVGNYLGETALAAVTVSFPIIFLLIAIAIGLTLGTGILVSQFAGAKDWAQLRRVVQTSTLMLACVSTGLLIIGHLTAPFIMRHMQTPPNVYAMAVNYLRIFLFTIPFSFGIFLMAATLRGIGDSKTPLYFQTGALVLTAIFDPILMFGWFGFPRFGLNGTAIASVSMQAIAMAALFIYLNKNDHLVAPDWRRLKADWPMSWLIVKIGFPSAVQQAIVSIGVALVLGLVNGFGEDATAAFGAATRIEQVAFLPALTFGMAVSTLVGQNLGAQRPERVKEIYRWGVLISGGITVLLSAILVAFPHPLLRMFLKDPDALQTGSLYLRIVGSCYVFWALMFISNGVINGAGYTFVTTIISLVSLWVARVPLAIYLTHHIHKVEMIWYAIGFSSVLGMIISLCCYLAGFWKRPLIKQHLAQAPAEEEEVVEEPANTDSCHSEFCSCNTER